MDFGSTGVVFCPCRGNIPEEGGLFYQALAPGGASKATLRWPKARSKYAFNGSQMGVNPEATLSQAGRERLLDKLA